MKAIRRILIALDFSPVADKLIETGVELGLALSAELRLIHAAAPDPHFVGYEPGPQTVRNERAKELKKEHVKLQNLADTLTSKGLDAEALLVQGPTADTLLTQAREWNADIIVMGNRGHGLFRKAVIGSVSEAVIRSARCPVVVVPAPMITEE